MTEWKTYRLKDVTSILGDGLHGTPVYDENGDVFFINGNNLENGHINIKSNTKRVSTEEAAKYRKPLNDRTILVSINGTIGNVGKYNNENCILGKSACYFNVAEDFDYDFIYYVIANDIFKNTISRLATGTTIKNVSLETMRNYTFCAPDITTQRRISKILGAIDDKIENNRRINDNLEQQAQALYKQWFVDSSTVKLGDVVKTTSGGTPSRSHMEFYVGKYGWVKSKELNSSFITKTEETITDDAIAKSAAKLLPAKSILIAMYGATVGQYAILSQPMTCNQAVCALLPNENYPYTYLFMVAKNIKEELANKAIGSAQQNISQVIIKDIDISSDIEIIKQFHKIVCPHFEVMEKNQKENETLATLRDTLLPKLMNGEIKL